MELISWLLRCWSASIRDVIHAGLITWLGIVFKVLWKWLHTCGFLQAISLRSLQKLTSDDLALFSSILPTVKILSNPPCPTSWIASRYDSILSSLTSVDLNSSAAVRTSAFVTGLSLVWLRQLKSAGETVSSAVNISMPTAHLSAW